jgi:hypothetical protein
MRPGIRLWSIGLRTTWIREAADATAHKLEQLCAGQKDACELADSIPRRCRRSAPRRRSEIGIRTAELTHCQLLNFRTIQFMSSITGREYRVFQQAYDVFSQELFGGPLPSCWSPSSATTPPATSRRNAPTAASSRPPPTSSPSILTASPTAPTNKSFPQLWPCRYDAPCKARMPGQGDDDCARHQWRRPAAEAI